MRALGCASLFVPVAISLACSKDPERWAIERFGAEQAEALRKEAAPDPRSIGGGGTPAAFAPRPFVIFRDVARADREGAVELRFDEQNMKLPEAAIASSADSVKSLIVAK